MKQNTFIAFNAIVGLTFGAILLVIPDVFLSFSGVQVNDVALVMARLFGAELLGFNLAGWLSLKDQSGSAQKLIVRGHVVSENLGFVAMLFAKLSGIGNALFWVYVAIFLVMGLGFLYFQFAKQN